MENHPQKTDTPANELFGPLIDGLDYWKYYAFIFIYFSVLLFLAQLYLYFIYSSVNTAIFSISP